MFANPTCFGMRCRQAQDKALYAESALDGLLMT